MQIAFHTVEGTNDFKQFLYKRKTLGSSCKLLSGLVTGIGIN